METHVKLDSGKVLRFNSISAREVILKYHTLSNVEEQVNENGDIIKVDIDDFSVGVKNNLNIKMFSNIPSIFKPLYIKRSVRGNGYVLNSTRLTKASRFILPMLGNNETNMYNIRYDSNYVNCYVGTKEEGYMNNIYLVYRFSGTQEYRLFEETLKLHPKFDTMIDIDSQHVMYVFNMDEEDKENFEYFKLGKYSKFTNKYKKKILNFIEDPFSVNENNVKGTLIYGVIYKTNSQKLRIENQIGQSISSDLEYYSLPDEKDEVYTGDIEISTKNALESSKLKEF